MHLVLVRYAPSHPPYWRVHTVLWRPTRMLLCGVPMRQPRPTPHVRTPSHVRARAMRPPRPLGSIPWVEPACGGAGVGRGGGGYAPGCLATPRSLLATVDFLAGSAADRGGGRGGIGTIFAGDRRRAVHRDAGWLGERYLTRQARWDTILGILARCGPHDWTVGRSVCGHAWCIPCAAPLHASLTPSLFGRPSTSA